MAPFLKREDLAPVTYALVIADSLSAECCMWGLPFEMV